MLVSIKESPLYRIANVRSIAFFGASNKIPAMGAAQLSSLLSLGFEGPVYPIHPTEICLHDLKVYRSVLDLPETPDLAAIRLSRDIVCQTMKEYGQKGIRQAIVVSRGVREASEKGEQRVILSSLSGQLL
jgi:acyl-CoA synthetase (NDP forming)